MNTDELISFAKSGVDERQTKKQLIKIALCAGIFAPFPLIFGIVDRNINITFGIVMAIAYIASMTAAAIILKDGMTVKKRLKANIVACGDIVIQYTLLAHFLHYTIEGPSKAVIYMYLPIIFMPLIMIVYMSRQLKSGSMQSIKKHVIVVTVISYALFLLVGVVGMALSDIGRLFLIIALTIFITGFFSARMGMQIIRLYCISMLEKEGVEI